MNRKNALRPAVVVILVLLIAAWWIRKGKPGQPSHRSDTVSAAGKHQQMIPTDAKLVYTRHARCRMDCRHITEAEVHEVLEEGVVNNAKSDPADTPCPTYAIEDKTKEGQHLRIVFARCDNVVKVITCIDLNQEFECRCE